MASEATDSETTAKPETRGLPLFYKEPRALSAERHGGKSLKPRRDYAFARDTNSVPLNAEEFKVAARFYPIVFTTTEPAVPVAVLGVKEAQNLFVDEAGAWTKATYIPAYVYRHPFIFSAGRNERQYVLCIDESSDLLTEGEGQPLFVDGEPSELVRKALDYCSAFQRQNELTRAFAAEIEKQGLLSEKEVNYTAAGGRRFNLRGLRVVDERKFNELPDDVFLEWRRRGWLHLVYCHLISIGNLTTLAELASRRDREET